MASTPGFKPGPHWWEASALTTAPRLLPHKSHYPNTNSPDGSPYISFKNIWENLIKHRNIFPLMIILLALVTFSLGNVLKLLENKWMLVTLGTWRVKTKLSSHSTETIFWSSVVGHHLSHSWVNLDIAAKWPLRQWRRKTLQCNIDWCICVCIYLLSQTG